MNPTRSPLRIIYTGSPVRVDRERITEDMRVPNLGLHDPRYADDCPGETAACLFREADSEGALVIPDGIVVACYSRDTHLTHDFMLVASPPGGNRTGVTQGWCDVGLLAREAGDTRADNDPEVVREALEVIAAKIDAVLNGE